MVLQHFQLELLLMFKKEENKKVLCQLWPVELASSLSWHQIPHENLDPEKKVANLTWSPTNPLINSFCLHHHYSSKCRLNGLCCN